MHRAAPSHAIRALIEPVVMRRALPAARWAPYGALVPSAAAGVPPGSPRARLAGCAGTRCPMPEFFDVVSSQRACRYFTDEPVSDEVIEQLLRAATFAPSAENAQPWVFVVVRDEEKRRAIS